MKRFLFSLALMALLPAMAFAEHVEPTRAQKVAKTFLSNNDVRSAQLTDVAPAAGFSNLYIFNANPGFVVMAADDRVQPILGYSLTGTFVTDDMPDNVRGWLQGYDDEIQAAIDHRMSASSETAQKWHDLENGVRAPRAVTVVDPLIQTRWNQNKYYNDLCPLVSDGPNGHAFTGCVATAMAQIMKYHNYPSHGIGTHSYSWNDQTLSADFGATTYDWGNMNLYYEYYFDDNGVYHGLSAPSSAQLAAIATLMYHCGVSVDMIYGGSSTGGSSAVTAFVADALKTYFNYSPDIEFRQKNSFGDEEWKTMVKAELDAARPLQYSGRSGSSGHSFVCDGYNNADYFHFNWGWSGNYDGYFSLDNLDTGANNQSGQGNGVYTYEQAAIFGIQPVQCAASEPMGLTYSLSGTQSVTLTWTAANGAASYNVYRNNNYIGNTTMPTFTEDAPFGTDVYFVRSVDASGNLSLSSNTVTVTIANPFPVVTDLAATATGNDVQLTWTAPAWCYPTTPSATLNHGEGSVYYLWATEYYAHRHLAADLAQYAGKAVYKVSTFIQYPGTYSAYVYTKSTQNGQPDPNSLVFSALEVPVTTSNAWYDFDLTSPAILTGSDDLWVVMKQENTGQTYPVPSFDLTEHNTNAFYAGSSPTYLYDANTDYNCAWLINAYLTDGTYTYNLYRDGTALANDMSDTQYTDSNLPDGTYSYYVTTNYYGGVTDPSNTVTVTVPGAFTQTVKLNEGWTWWTPTVTTSLTDLEIALGTNGILINSQDGGFVRYEIVEGQGHWNGTLQGFVPGQMYKINVQTVTTITLTGTPVAASTISILPGYNWFGYTGEAGLSIDKALGEDFTPNVDDQIIGQDGTAQYGANGWSGTLGSLVPGRGYIYQSTATRTKPITF